MQMLHYQQQQNEFMLIKLMNLVNNNTVQIMNLHQVHSISFRKFLETNDKLRPFAARLTSLDKAPVSPNPPLSKAPLPKSFLKKKQENFGRNLLRLIPQFKNFLEERTTNTGFNSKRLFLKPFTKRETSTSRLDQLIVKATRF